jgi:hypothetical protein
MAERLKRVSDRRQDNLPRTKECWSCMLSRIKQHRRHDLGVTHVVVKKPLCSPLLWPHVRQCCRWLDESQGNMEYINWTPTVDRPPLVAPYHQTLQVCTLLQFPVRLYGNNRILNSFTASLHLQEPVHLQTKKKNGHSCIIQSIYTKSYWITKMRVEKLYFK